MSQSKVLQQYECTKNCRSRQHGSLLTAAVTRRSVSDAALASFLRCACLNFLRVFDHQGRSVIHMVSSRGRCSLLEWLIKHLPANQQGPALIDSRDSESGYTALHRSIFYGQIHTAIALIKLGINISTLDNESLTAIDLALIDRHPRFMLSKSFPCEVYCWGNNANYTLGNSSQNQKSYPELLALFTKQKIHIKKVCLGKFHSIFVSSCGGVWSCGHGEGGRLGIATRDTRVIPTQISLSEPCIDAAVGRDHTLLLLKSGTILSCGLNNFHQLGLGQVPPPPHQLSPRPIKLTSINGVYAGRYHSVAYNTRAIYTWGLNGGQLGHAKEEGKFITTPKKVLGMGSGKEAGAITLVAVSDGAIVSMTLVGDTYINYQYQCKKIVSRLKGIKSIRIIGGEICGGDKLTDQQKVVSVLMLNSEGNLYLWQDNTNELVRCILNPNRFIFVATIALTREFVMITTKRGEAFQGKIMPRKPAVKKANSPDEPQSPKEKNSFNKAFYQFLDMDDCHVLKLKKIPNVHRAVEIFSDLKANNFAVLQVIPNVSLLDIPQISSSQMKDDLIALLNEASDMDFLHDVIIKVDNRTFPAHQYIISFGSDYFSKICHDHKAQISDNTETLVITLDEIHPIMLNQILMYLYTGSCDLMIPGPCAIKIEGDSKYTKALLNDEEDIVDENLSAYEVNKKRNTKNKKSEEKIKNTGKKSSHCDPVRLLQATAKKLNIVSLYKLLAKYACSNGCVIIRKEDCKIDQIKYGFDRNMLTDFWDTNIKCSDGSIIKAHKCILAARLEYFNGMFCHTWAENTKYSSISLPISSKMLNPIINFLYTDECPELKEWGDFDFLGNMIVISDQLFITRMREMCEVALSEMLTLKNISDILMISDTYNCSQLKNCCLEFISLNLPTLLETKTLECLPSKILEDVTAYYCEFNPKMSHRVITPFSESIDENVIEDISATFPTNLEEVINEDVLKDIKKEFTSIVRKKGKTRKSSQSESEKVGEEKESNDLQTEENPFVLNDVVQNVQIETATNGWTKVISNNSKQQKIVQARLKAVISAKDNVDLLSSTAESYTKLLGSNAKSLPININTRESPVRSHTRGSPYQSSSFDCTLNSSFDDSYEDLVDNSINVPFSQIKLSQKISQKQRKRLMSESKEATVKEKSSQVEVEVEVSPPQKNPWKKIEATPTVMRVSRVNNFSDILEDQRKQRENLTKLMTKSLLLTQMEDKAIEELTKLYLSMGEESERITVKRVTCTQIATPQWLYKSFNNNSVT